MTTVTRSSRRSRRREALLLACSLLLTVGAYVLVLVSSAPTLPETAAPTAAVIAGLYVAMHFAVRRLAPSASAIYLPVVGLLNGIGFAMISRLKPELALNQGFWILVGCGAFLFTLVVLTDYRVLDRYRYTALVAGIVLLLSPLLPVVGRTINGSRLWVGVGSIVFQPGELAKILLTIFFAAYLSEKRELVAVSQRRIAGIPVPDPKHLGPMLLVWALSLAGMMLQKDLGSSLLLFSVFLVVLYVATGRVSYVVLGVTLFAIGAVCAWALFPHVQVRLTGWLAPINAETFNTTAVNQLAQAQFAFAAGGIFGTGLGLGRPSQIPIAFSDFIFAALGEELGLVGVCGLLAAYLLLVGNGLRTALRCIDPFGKLLAAGFAATIGLQTFIICGGVSRLIPLTGITLPFISYGGSSIVANFIIVAILVAISDQQVNGPRGHGLVRRRAIPVGTLLEGAA